MYTHTHTHTHYSSLVHNAHTHARRSVYIKGRAREKASKAVSQAQLGREREQSVVCVHWVNIIINASPRLACAFAECLDFGAFQQQKNKK